MTPGGEVLQTDSEPVAPSNDESGRELNRIEILRGMRLSIWDGAFATVHGTLTAGAFLTGFALWLGANDLALGLLTAIPTFAGLVQIVASYFGPRERSRKRYVAWFALFSRALWLPILLAPVLLPRPLALPAFLVTFALSFGLLNFTVPAWTSWMSDLVPADHRGRYFARRNTVAGIVGMAIGLPAAWFLDLSTRGHHWEATGFGVLFSIGIAGGFASFLALLRQPEPPPRVSATSLTPGLHGIVEFYRAPFADINFRRLLIFNMVFVTGQFFAAPFFTVYALKNLHLDYIWLQVYATLSGLAGLGSMAFWGYMTDKFGNKPLLAIGVVGVFFLPIAWMLTAPERPHIALAVLTANNLAGGLFWACVGLTQFNLLIRLSPPERTGVYVATMAALTGLTGGMAPLAGSLVMHALRDWHAHLFGFGLLNFHVTFAIAALLRIIALIFLGPVVDASSTPTRDVLQQLSETPPRAWRDIQRLRGALNEETRLRATAALAGSRTRLAASELITALLDPSLAVREEAARALGEIGDPHAVPVLIEAVQDPTGGLSGEAARALGRIGDRSATPALTAVLTDHTGRYSRADRILVVRALGALGGSDAADALLQLFGRTGDDEAESEEEMEAATRALGLIGDTRPVPTLAEQLRRDETPRPLRLALVRALGELGHPSAVAALRETIAEAVDDGVLFPLLADALARLNDRDSVPALLKGILGQESSVARRQIAHAIGTIIGEGDALYALLAQEEFTRDAAIARLAEDIRKQLRVREAINALDEALNAYLVEDYATCVTLLSAAGNSTRPIQSSARPPSAMDCEAALQQIAMLDERPISVELALIAWCALRGTAASQ